MSIFEIVLIGIGLSMDAFAVAMCRGLSMKKINIKITFYIAFCFGFFQALMPFIGYILGSQFEKYVNAYTHWIAFALLGFIGIKMFLEAFKNEDDETEENINIPELIIMGIATSIDALAVGISFAVLHDINIVSSVIFIGTVTFILSLIAVFIGMKFGDKFKSKAQMAGGVILFVIGLKILLENIM